jgi:hypothetical protein
MFLWVIMGTLSIPMQKTPQSEIDRPPRFGLKISGDVEIAVENFSGDT